MRNRIIKYTACGSLVLTTLLFSCAKKADTPLQTNSNFSNQTTMQLFMAMVNANRNYILVDGNPVNGASITSGTVFPALGPGFAIDAGFRSFLVYDNLATATQVPLSFAQNLQAGKNYTIFMYDTITAPKQKTVETTLAPSANSAQIRFANFVYSPTATPNIDIYSAKRNANIFSNIPVSEVTNFIPYNIDVTDTFYVRIAGSGMNLQNYRNCNPTGFVDITTSLTPRANRCYTLVFRGSYRGSNVFSSCGTTTPVSNASVRTLSVFSNN